MKKWMLLFAVAAGMSFAGVKTYNVTLPDKTVIAGTQLKAGDYSLRLEGSHAIFLRYGKTVAQADVKVDNAAKKYGAQEIQMKSIDGVSQVQEIDLAGTRMKLEFQN